MFTILKLLTERIGYLAYGENRDVHIVFKPKTHSIGYLNMHRGFYKNAFRLLPAEIDLVIIFIELWLIALNFQIAKNVASRIGVKLPYNLQGLLMNLLAYILIF